MNETEPKVTLEGLEDLRLRTRRRAHPSWLPLLIFGVLSLGAVPFALGGDDGYDGFYWLAAGPLGGALTWILARRRGLEIGLEDRNFNAYAAIIAAMVAGALAIGWAGGEGAFSEAGTVYPIAIGLVAIAAIARSPLLAATGAALAAWGTGVLIADPEEVAAWTYAGEGAILIVAGLASLAGSRSSDAAPAKPGAGAAVGI